VVRAAGISHKILKHEGFMNTKALYNLTYGVYFMSAQENGKDNACIINTAVQVASEPNRISIAVNKSNYTHDMVTETGMCNVSVISNEADFALFKHFGFSSGKDVDKFEGKAYPRSENGLYYIYENSNAFISCKVVGQHDYGTHTLFVGEVTEAKVLSDHRSLSYEQYLTEVKPQRKPVAEQPKGKSVEKKDEPQTEKWVCKVCGYVHEGPLPDDFICPWCKHPASDFERVS
jgi:flavin reductase (DIM6/NTAB) family NADH-FMN oxidoreductase RutF/rubredoxin